MGCLRCSKYCYYKGLARTVVLPSLVLLPYIIAYFNTFVNTTHTLLILSLFLAFLIHEGGNLYVDGSFLRNQFQPQEKESLLQEVFS